MSIECKTVPMGVDEYPQGGTKFAGKFEQAWSLPRTTGGIVEIDSRAVFLVKLSIR